MSKFQLEAQTVQIITTEDGKEFNSMEAAVAHQNLLDAAAVIAAPVQSYLNDAKMIDRNRKQKQTVAESVMAFLVAQGVDLSGVATIERTAEDTPAAEKVEAKEDAPAAESEEPAKTEEDSTEELF